MNPMVELVIIDQDIAIFILFISFVLGVVIANLVFGKIIKSNKVWLSFVVEGIVPIAVCYGIGVFIVDVLLQLQY